MVRGHRLAGLAAACLALTACGSAHHVAVPPLAKPTPKPKPRPVVTHAVLVTVLDGDTGRAVPHARVAVGPAARRTTRVGIAALPIRHDQSLPVRITAPGYIPLQTRVQFRRTPQVGLRIYRRRLQWTMYGANPQRTQAHASIRVRPPFKVVWAKSLGSLVEFPAAIDRGVAYVSNLHGVLWALSMEDGSVLWHRYLGHWEQDSSPAVVGDTVVAHSKGGRVWVLARNDGKVLWSFGAASYIESSPVVIDHVDYFGDWAGNLYALDLRTHKLRWERSFGAKITSSIAVNGNTLYFGDYAGRVWAVARASGAVRWSGSVNGRVYGTPAVGGGRVFVPSSTGGSLTAFTTRGERLWSYGTGAYVYSSPAYWGGRVYVGAYNGVLYSFSASSGRVLWTVGAGGAISGAPVVVDGVVYAGSFAHRIVGADAHSGRVLFTFPHGEYVPLSANGGRVLLVGYNRVFAAIPKR